MHSRLGELLVVIGVVVAASPDARAEDASFEEITYTSTRHVKGLDVKWTLTVKPDCVMSYSPGDVSPGWDWNKDPQVKETLARLATAFTSSSWKTFSDKVTEPVAKVADYDNAFSVTAKWKPAHSWSKSERTLEGVLTRETNFENFTAAATGAKLDEVLKDLESVIFLLKRPTDVTGVVEKQEGEVVLRDGDGVVYEFQLDDGNGYYMGAKQFEAFVGSRVTVHGAAYHPGGKKGVIAPTGVRATEASKVAASPGGKELAPVKKGDLLGNIRADAGKDGWLAVEIDVPSDSGDPKVSSVVTGWIRKDALFEPTKTVEPAKPRSKGFVSSLGDR